MPAQYQAIKKLTIAALFIATVLTIVAAFGQTPVQDQGDVIRVYSDLVQTDVMVFDKNGRFVNGLKREDFQLKIDGKIKPIEFYERVTAGSNEEVQLAAARGAKSSNPATPTAPVPLDRGRAIFFYVDDFHLDPQGLDSARKVITKFIEDEMGQNDEAAVASATGQIGFLQQLTDNRAVLQAALKRIAIRSYNVRDSQQPPMTESQGLAIDNSDIDVTDFFIEETIRFNPGINRETAASIVRGRAQTMLQQASYITRNTLSGLESLVRSTAALPGRKLIFFISGGFFLDNRNSDSINRLQRITSAAARNGVVIYSMDARGLAVGLPDASSDVAFDPAGRLLRTSLGELSDSQNGMHALAHDTGGRAVFNTNDLGTGLLSALQETSVYYLLAWKPDQQGEKPGRFHKIEASVVGRPDLTVRVRRGFFDLEPSPTTAKKENEKTPEAAASAAANAIRAALTAPFAIRRLPISLTLSFLDNKDKGSFVSAWVSVPAEFITFGPENDKQQATIDLVGTFYNERGQPGASFSERIDVTTTSADIAQTHDKDIGYSYPVHLEPGLYQVRVAARDQRTGRVGSTQQWIEIPDLSRGQLALSSLILGERKAASVAAVSTNSPDKIDAAGLSIDHRFRDSSVLRFLVFVYNSLHISNAPKPDVAVQIQVVRDKQPVVTTALRKIDPEGILDLTRLPYAAEVPLEGLPKGLYLLKLTVIDRITKQSSSQQTRFEIY